MAYSTAITYSYGYCPPCGYEIVLQINIHFAEIDTIRYDTIRELREGILTCAQKLT